MGVRTSGTRQFDLDPFRGLVCLWLMALHLCLMSEAHLPLLRIVGPDAADLAFRARLGVESFLVLSGFMMAHMLRPVPGEDVRLGAYFLRRCYRLLLPFWVAVLMAGADRWMTHLLFDRGSGRPDLTALLAQLLLVNEFFGIPEPAVGYWSLATLEQFYLLWIACFAVVRWTTSWQRESAYQRSFARMGVVALVVFLASGVAYLGFGPATVRLALFSFYIALGILLYGNTQHGLYRWELRIALAGMAAAAIVFQHPRLAAALAATAVLYVLACGARFPGGRVIDALRWVGCRSYSVYLIHAVVGIRILTGLRFLAGYDDLVAVPLVFGAAVGSLAGAAVFYRCVERPCQALVRRVQYRVPLRDVPRVNVQPQVLAEALAR